MGVESKLFLSILINTFLVDRCIELQKAIHVLGSRLEAIWHNLLTVETVALTATRYQPISSRGDVLESLLKSFPF